MVLSQQLKSGLVHIAKVRGLNFVNPDLMCYACPGPGGLLEEAQDECRAPVEWAREVGAGSLRQR